MNITIIKPPATINLGNDFIFYGGLYLIETIFHKHNIKVIEFFDSCESYRQNTTEPFTKSSLEYLEHKTDLIIFFGGCALNPSLYEKLFVKLKKLHKPFIPFGVGCCNYNDIEREIATKVMEMSKILITRDSYAYDFIKDDPNSLNGIDCGFFAGDYFKTPNEYGNYAICNIDSGGELCLTGKAEPQQSNNAFEFYDELIKNFDEVYIITNNTQRHAYLDNNKILHISSAHALWSILKNSKKVITTRAHTTVCCLTEGIDIDYYGFLDNRALGIFENVGIDIKNNDHKNLSNCRETIITKKKNYIKELTQFFIERGYDI